MRRAWVASAAASFTVAVAAAGYLATRNAPRFDEMHTLAYARQRDLGDVWTAYRQVRDTLPPTAYLLSWGWARVAGTGLVATRAPMVVAWGVAAAALSVLSRRAGAWPAFVAGIVPTATTLVFVGAFARPYAPAFAAFAVGLVCWERAGEAAARGTAWLAGAAAMLAVASFLHYAMAAAAVVVGVVAAATGAERARHRLRAVVPAAAGVVPVLASAALVPAAIRDQGRLPRSVSTLDAVRFWPSAFGPVWWPAVPLFALALGVVLAQRAGSARSLRRELVWVGAGLAVVVPVAVVAAMAITSGTYVHRYGVAALAGAALLAAQLTARAQGSHRAAGPVLALALVVGTYAAADDTSARMISRADAQALPARLGLLRSGDEPVMVADEYDFLLLQTYAPAALRTRLRLAVDPVVAGSGPVVDLAARLERGPSGPDDHVLLVGSRADLDRLVPPGSPWHASVVARAGYDRPGVDRELVTARIEPG